jgi:hypothetical protein
MEAVNVAEVEHLAALARTETDQRLKLGNYES